MKIAVLVYSLAGVGGLAKHMLHLSREFVAMGHQIVIYAMEYNKDQCYPEITKELEIETIRLASPPIIPNIRRPPGLRMLVYMGELWNSYRDQQKLSSVIPPGYDVVNAHGDRVSWAAVAYKRRYGTPVVWLSNDFLPPGSHRYEVASTPLKKIKRIVKESLCFPVVEYDQTAVREIDKIAVLSKRVQSQMREYYRVNPVVVRAGVDALRFGSGEGQRVRRYYGIRDDSFLLLTVCMPMPRRRLEDVIRAVRLLLDEGQDVTYLVVGRTTYHPEYMEFVRAEVSACNLNERVIFAGEVAEDELVDCYHACDAFIWASDENQSWGLAGMEAMAAGKPVVVSRANGLAEVLEDEVALLFPPRSPEAIAEAVKQLTREPKLVDSMAKMGQRFVRERYSWRNHAEEMQGLLQSAIDKRRA